MTFCPCPQFYPAIPDALVKKFGEDGLRSSWFAAEGPGSQPQGDGKVASTTGTAPVLLQVQQQSAQPLWQSNSPPPPVSLVRIALPTNGHATNGARGTTTANFVFPDFPPPNSADGSVPFPTFPTRNTPSCEATDAAFAGAVDPDPFVTVLRRPQLAVSMYQAEPLQWSDGEVSQC